MPSSGGSRGPNCDGWHHIRRFYWLPRRRHQLLRWKEKGVAEARKLDAEAESTRAETKRKKAEARRLTGELAAHSRNLDSMPDIDGLVGWFAAGSAPEKYRFGVDREMAHQGSGSGFMWSRTAEIEDDFGTLMQMFKADDYRGPRYRLSAWIRSEDVKGWAGLWMRVDGPETDETNESLAFDNMQRRPICGTTDWRVYRVVLDVPENATYIAFGILLSGSGRVWIDDVTFESVGEDVQLTAGRRRREYPNAPSNLDFEERP